MLSGRAVLVTKSSSLVLSGDRRSPWNRISKEQADEHKCE